MEKDVKSIATIECCGFYELDEVIMPGRKHALHNVNPNGVQAIVALSSKGALSIICPLEKDGNCQMIVSRDREKGKEIKTCTYMDKLDNA